MEYLIKVLMPIGQKEVVVNLVAGMMNAGVLHFVNKYTGITLELDELKYQLPPRDKHK